MFSHTQERLLTYIQKETIQKGKQSVTRRSVVINQYECSECSGFYSASCRMNSSFFVLALISCQGVAAQRAAIAPRTSLWLALKWSWNTRHGFCSTQLEVNRRYRVKVTHNAEWVRSPFPPGSIHRHKLKQRHDNPNSLQGLWRGRETFRHSESRRRRSSTCQFKQFVCYLTSNLLCFWSFTYEICATLSHFSMLTKEYHQENIIKVKLNTV